ncbi:RNA-directed DNA polymerase [Jatrophihabitans endophyticus]|uniref:RNA-directed DNA polymerase n=1 Tax=Jatrophihabitans endophyticus TaxID=1206085 RepID=A0A1M5R2F4_9ACTN|nr:reverse transcriptase family protein [Jatrophihabitans endophyticus]SHH20361.1 RNA-directed DNA polymerase [Jatrophihabitans endophyticus]
MTGAGPAGPLADGLATALLAGPWTRPAMRTRGRDALGAARTPVWLGRTVDAVLTAYPQPPADRPRELAAFLLATAEFAKLARRRPPPRVVSWSPVPTDVMVRPWPVELLPDHAALAGLLDVDQGELAWFADVRGLERSSPEPLRHYRWRTVAKPGGVRVLAAPKPRLKEIQRRLLRHVFDAVPVHPAAHGGVRRRSVLTASAPHAAQPVVVRVDLVSFFASVRAGRVWRLLRTAGVPEGVAHTVTGLVTTVAPLPFRALDPRLRTPHLPQGAPTSPALANLIAFSLDRRLTGLAARFDASYTRYADDLVFSGGRGLGAARFLDRVGEIVRDEGFRVHDGKTAVLGRSGRQQVLGVVLNHHPAVPRRERDALRALLHNCATTGWRAQARDRDDFPAHVLGRIAWVQSLDPVHGRRLRAAYDAVDWS